MAEGCGGSGASGLKERQADGRGVGIGMWAAGRRPGMGRTDRRWRHWGRHARPVAGASGVGTSGRWPRTPGSGCQGPWAAGALGPQPSAVPHMLTCSGGPAGSLKILTVMLNRC